MSPPKNWGDRGRYSVIRWRRKTTPNARRGSCAAFMVPVMERQRGRQTALTGMGITSSADGKQSPLFEAALYVVRTFQTFGLAI